MELTGIGVGSRAAVGSVFLLETSDAVYEQRASARTPSEEAGILQVAITTTVATIRVEVESGDKTTREILDALLTVIEDVELQEMAKPFLEQGLDAASALYKALDEFAELMGDDADFQSRAEDLRGIAARISAWVRGIAAGPEIPAEGQLVIVAKDLTPLETSQFGDSVVGVVTERGGPTSHTAIICRALGIPAVVSCVGALTLPQNQSVLVDPAGNRVVTEGDITDATTTISFVPVSDSPLITVRANIGSLEDALAARDTLARGVGLFRTEVLYLDTATAPSVEEQTKSYVEVFEQAPAGKIIVRTIDAGSDKPVPFLALAAEENPALGVRGFRMAQHYEDFMQSQLTAIGLAIQATGRDVGVMAPMVSTIEEVEHFAAMCAHAGVEHKGIMVETPAIISLLPELAGVLDFLSIGTNDLSQYLFAADRLHPELGAFNSPWQPALLRQVAQIARVGAEAGMTVGVCGEAAAHPLLAIVFAGMGVDSLSVATTAVDEVHAALRGVTRDVAHRCAEAALSARYEKECQAEVRKVFLS